MEHLNYMKQALVQAKRAYKHHEVPIGAIVVNAAGVIIGRGYNQVEKKKQQLAHAEIRAITQACRKLGDWRLDGCWIYVTLEPCALCMNLILLSRIHGLAFGASSPLFGYKLDNRWPLQVYRRNTLEIISGIALQESAALLKNFFKERRISSERGKKNN